VRKQSPANCIGCRTSARFGVVARRYGGNALPRRARRDPVSLSKAIVPINDRVAAADDLQGAVANDRPKQALTLRAAAVGLRAVLVGKWAIAIACAAGAGMTLVGDDDVLGPAAGTKEERRDQRSDGESHGSPLSWRPHAPGPASGMQRPAKTAGRTLHGSKAVVD
jgi:hypothetical protein